MFGGVFATGPNKVIADPAFHRKPICCPCWSLQPVTWPALLMPLAKLVPGLMVGPMSFIDPPDQKNACMSFEAVYAQPTISFLSLTSRAPAAVPPTVPRSEIFTELTTKW